MLNTQLSEGVYDPVNWFNLPFCQMSLAYWLNNNSGYVGWWLYVRSFSRTDGETDSSSLETRAL